MATPSQRHRPRHDRVCRGVMALLLAAASAGAWCQIGPGPRPAAPPLGGLGQGPGGTRVQVFVNARAVAAAKKKVDPDNAFPVYGFRAQPGPQGVALRPDSDELMQRWKGGFVLGTKARATFETADQFLPAMLVVDISNESGAPVQVTNAYLEVQASMTDRQPYMQFSAWGSEVFDLRNQGWGRAENAQLVFAFGRDRPATETFTYALGSLGSVEVSTVRAMSAVVPAVAQLQARPPRCRSNAQVPACLAQLERAAPLGRLGQIAYLRENFVLTRIIGTLSYQWRDASGAVQRREHPVNAEMQLFRFDTGETAEMGAAGPEEGGFRPITLALDRMQYRVPLPYRPRLQAGQNGRFELTLNATKSSQHLFSVVLEMSDGSRAASPPIDLLIFVPNLDIGEARQVR